jgi:hypothetical protein
MLQSLLQPDLCRKCCTVLMFCENEISQFPHNSPVNPVAGSYEVLVVEFRIKFNSWHLNSCYIY